MPQKGKFMRDEVAFSVTTGTGAVLYSWTPQNVLIGMWVAYVAVLIVIKLPELTIALTRIHSCLGRRWANLKKVLRREK